MSEQNVEWMRQAIIGAIRDGRWPGPGVQEHQVRTLDAGDVTGLYNDMLRKHGEASDSQ